MKEIQPMELEAFHLSYLNGLRRSAFHLLIEDVILR